MTSNTLAEAASVFNTLDRWTAFYEIERHTNEIKELWLATGAKALRAHFASNQSPGWKCEKWGTERDTRWYLSSEPEGNTIGVGIGWSEFELHLFHSGCDPEIREKAQRMMETERFGPLRMLVGKPSDSNKRRREDGSIYSDLDFNPFGPTEDRELRLRIIAWHAVNDTTIFVKNTVAKVREIIDNPHVFGLVSELNELCRSPRRQG